MKCILERTNTSLKTLMLQKQNIKTLGVFFLYNVHMTLAIPFTTQTAECNHKAVHRGAARQLSHAKQQTILKVQTPLSVLHNF